MDLGQIERGGVDWIGQALDRYHWKALVNTDNELSGFIKFWEVLEYLHNWRSLEKVLALWS
jgi:hypothetical protein